MINLKKKPTLFILVGHCGTPYSKSVIPCPRPRTALWRWAARQVQSDGSLRLMGVGSWASSMFTPRWFTIIPAKNSSLAVSGEPGARLLAVSQTDAKCLHPWHTFLNPIILMSKLSNMETARRRREIFRFSQQENTFLIAKIIIFILFLDFSPLRGCQSD